MRILLVLAAILAAFVAGILFATSGTEVGVTPATQSATGIEADRASPQLAEDLRVPAAPAITTSEPVPDRVRKIMVHTAPSIIAGIVRHADGTPTARAIVGLFAPAVLHDGEDSAFSAATTMHARRLERFRVVRVWTRSDDEGRFTFDDVLDGTWIVRAEDGPLLAAATLPLVLREGISHSGLVIELPPAARLEGRAMFPKGTSLDDLCLEIRANSPRSIAPWMHTLRDPVVCVRERLDEGGHFRIGPVEPGLYTVGLVVERALATGGRVDPLAGSVAPLVDVYLGPGTTKRDIDLTSGIPGVVELHLDLGGFTPSSTHGQTRWNPGQRIRARLQPLFETTGKGPGTIEVEADQPSDLGPLVAGTWRITLDFPADSLWSWPLDPPVHVRPGERVRYEARIPIRRAEIDFFDAKSGLPIAGLVEIGRETEDGFTFFGYVAGEDGKLSLVLPPGSYVAKGRDESLEDLILDPSKYARFEWSEAGPSVTSLRMPR